jgi:hypothetical protein
MSHVTGNETDAEKISRLQGLIHKLEGELKDSQANINRIIAAIQNPDLAALMKEIRILQDKLTEPLNEAGEIGIEQGIKIANLEGELVDAQREIKGRISELNDVEQYLGQALGYPWYKDDPVNFPDCTDADGVCVGEHTPSTIAAEAAKKIVKQGAKINELNNRCNEMDSMRLRITSLQDQLDEAREAQISIMDFDYPPIAQQGAPNHEVLDLLTADDVNRWIKRIQELTVSNEGLNNQVNRLTLDMNNAVARAERAEETYKSLSDDANYQITYRAGRISQLENCVRWALRKLIYSRTNPLVPTVGDRAGNMFTHLFPPLQTSRPNDTYYDPNRLNVATDEQRYLQNIEITPEGLLRRRR